MTLSRSFSRRVGAVSRSAVADAPSRAGWAQSPIGPTYDLLIARSPVPALLAIHGAQKFVRANQALLDLLGYRADEVDALVPADILHPLDVSRQRSIAVALVGGLLRTASTNLRLLTKDGYTLSVTGHDSAVRIGDRITILTLIEDRTESVWEGHA